MSRKLQFKRGTKAKLPTLAEGEPGFVTDEKKLYIGTGTENVPMARDADLIAHTVNKSNPHGVTKSHVGLVNVPNVATNDQTPTFTQATSRANLASGEKLSVLFGKLMKWFADLKTVAFSGSYNDLSDKPTSMTPTAHTHAQGDVTGLSTALSAKAERKTATGTLSTTGWTGSAGNWSQAVTVSWMLAADVPKARLTGTTAAQMDAWDTLEPYVDSAAGKVTFYCKQTAKPSAAMSVGIEVIR